MLPQIALFHSLLWLSSIPLYIPHLYPFICQHLGVHASFWVIVLSGYMTRSGIAESYGNSIFHFLRNPLYCFLSGYTNLHTHQMCRFPFTPHPVQRLLFAGFIMMGILTSVRWYYIVVLVWVSLMVSGDQHLFMCLLAICMFSLEKCLFRSSAHFLIGLFVSCYWAVWPVYIWKLNPCWSYHLQIFSPLP